MARPLCSLDGKKTHSNSQKSNDRILLIYLTVLTRQENYGLVAKSDSVFGIIFAVFLPN